MRIVQTAFLVATSSVHYLVSQRGNLFGSGRPDPLLAFPEGSDLSCRHIVIRPSSWSRARPRHYRGIIDLLQIYLLKRESWCWNREVVNWWNGVISFYLSFPCHSLKSESKHPSSIQGRTVGWESLTSRGCCKFFEFANLPHPNPSSPDTGCIFVNYHWWNSKT